MLEPCCTKVRPKNPWRTKKSNKRRPEHLLTRRKRGHSMEGDREREREKDIRSRLIAEKGRCRVWESNLLSNRGMLRINWILTQPDSPGQSEPSCLCTHTHTRTRTQIKDLDESTKDCIYIYPGESGGTAKVHLLLRRPRLLTPGPGHKRGQKCNPLST